MTKKATTLDAVQMHRDDVDLIMAAGEVVRGKCQTAL
jgi:NACalpha-BTF3-like transcription factor